MQHSHSMKYFLVLLNLLTVLGLSSRCLQIFLLNLTLIISSTIHLPTEISDSSQRGQHLSGFL